jgi:ABC-type phosphate transport system substrate-binding protein
MGPPETMRAGLLRGGCLALLAAVLVCAADAGAEETPYKLIVHQSNPLTAVSREELSKIFLKKTRRWPDNRPAQPVDLNDASPVRARFSRDVHDRALSAVLAYWRQKIFSGAGVPPPEKRSDAEIIAYVSANPNAVGYVSAATALTVDVKVLEVTR